MINFLGLQDSDDEDEEDKVPNKPAPAAAAKARGNGAATPMQVDEEEETSEEVCLSAVLQYRCFLRVMFGSMTSVSEKESATLLVQCHRKPRMRRTKTMMKWR